MIELSVGMKDAEKFYSSTSIEELVTMQDKVWTQHDIRGNTNNLFKAAAVTSDINCENSYLPHFMLLISQLTIA